MNNIQFHQDQIQSLAISKRQIYIWSTQIAFMQMLLKDHVLVCFKYLLFCEIKWNLTVWQCVPLESDSLVHMCHIFLQYQDRFTNLRIMFFREGMSNNDNNLMCNWKKVHSIRWLSVLSVTQQYSIFVFNFLKWLSMIFGVKLYVRYTFQFEHCIWSVCILLVAPAIISPIFDFSHCICNEFYWRLKHFLQCPVTKESDALKKCLPINLPKQVNGCQ